MLQGHARYGKSRLEAEQPWNVRQSTSLEAKVLREKVTYGLEIF